jgi:hypothetical protein
MRYSTTVALLATALAGCMPLAADLEGGGPSVALEPDPNYRPRISDRAVLYGVTNGSVMDRIPLARDATAFDKYERVSQSVGTELVDLEELGDLSWTPSGTRVALIAIHDRSHTGSRIAGEIRLLDGPMRDRKAWTPLEYIVRLRAIEQK